MCHGLIVIVSDLWWN